MWIYTYVDQKTKLIFDFNVFLNEIKIQSSFIFTIVVYKYTRSNDRITHSIKKGFDR